MELLKKTAVEQHKALVNKEVSALELTQASIEKLSGWILKISISPSCQALNHVKWPKIERFTRS